MAIALAVEIPLILAVIDIRAEAIEAMLETPLTLAAKPACIIVLASQVAIAADAPITIFAISQELDDSEVQVDVEVSAFDKTATDSVFAIPFASVLVPIEIDAVAEDDDNYSTDAADAYTTIAVSRDLTSGAALTATYSTDEDSLTLEASVSF